MWIDQYTRVGNTVERAAVEELESATGRPLLEARIGTFDVVAETVAQITGKGQSRETSFLLRPVLLGGRVEIIPDLEGRSIDSRVEVTTRRCAVGDVTLFQALLTYPWVA